MTLRDKINNDYFKWLSDLVCGRRFSKQTSRRKLLMLLHDIEFIATMKKDENRAMDGISLRRRFALVHDCEDYVDYLDGPCSVLELMVGLAIHMEEDIMEDPDKGDRTGQWFWGMIVSLGLGGMSDGIFDKRYIKYVIDKFMYRDYEPNGAGGLFTLKRTDEDLRKIEIWYQMTWYLDEFLGI